MEVHQIDVVSVQSFCYHVKVLTKAFSVHRVFLIEDAVRVRLCCIISIPSPLHSRLVVSFSQLFKNYNVFSVHLLTLIFNREKHTTTSLCIMLLI